MRSQDREQPWRETAEEGERCTPTDETRHEGRAAKLKWSEDEGKSAQRATSEGEAVTGEHTEKAGKWTEE